MSKLDLLIKELCPSGVEYKPLDTLVELKRGERITKRALVDDGEFICMSGGVKPMGRYHSKNREANTITISSYGAAGYVGWITESFWANDVCLTCFIRNEDKTLKKYVYYALKAQQQHIYDNTTKAIPDHIPTQFLKELEIPVPPVEVQEEIVQILDSFSALEAELEAELEARKKQYAYYRDKLLTFSTDIRHAHPR